MWLLSDNAKPSLMGGLSFWLLAISHWLFFTDPLRYARPPNFGGQYYELPSFSSPKLGEVPKGRWGLFGVGITLTTANNR